MDGCRAGWIAALGHRREADGEVRLALRLCEGPGGLRRLIEWCEARRPAPPVVGIDIPIGLPEPGARRRCDDGARRRLGRRASCVFAPPDRALLPCSFEAARELVLERRRADPAGAHPVMSRQAMNIAPRIAEVDRLVRDRPGRPERIVEVHPELSLLAMAARGGREEPIAGLPPRRTTAGRAARLALLESALPGAGAVVAATPWPRAQVAPDDAVDALAALWSALRHAGGASECLGGDVDAAGLVRRIVV